MFKDNKDFYPTPYKLALKMAGMIEAKYSNRILEPSAGKGDLAEAVKNKFNRNGYSHGSQLDCIENDADLRATLEGKGHRVIDSDFLAYSGSKQYDTIIMNPPFSNGARHVLKAWGMMYDGDVIALLNAETLLNACTKERVLLFNIVEEFGTVEYIQDAFLDAERKTGVEVALIHLKKRNSIITDYFDGMTRASREYVKEEHTDNQLVLSGRQIESSVTAYNKAIECQKESILKGAEAKYYASMIRKADAKEDKGERTQTVKEEINEYVDKLRESAWTDIVNLTEFREHMTAKVLTEFEKKIETVKKLEFTEQNIRQFLQNLISNRGEIINDCVLEVFDNLTRYHEENRVHIEGWKSNDYFFINKRVVLPWIVESDWNDDVRVRWEKQNELRDMDKALAFIAGKKKPEVSIMDILGEGKLLGKKHSSTFFDIRVFKKRTAHFYFKDLNLLEKLNLFVGQQRGWLPKEEKKVPKEFWLMNK
jgi:methylase of polypeptide subunit release factors